MQIFSMILFLLIAFLTILLSSKIVHSKKLILNSFKDGNVIVFGKKGKGKDLLFQYVIYHNKSEYFSNLDYGYNYNNINLSDLTINNSYLSFIQNTLEPCEKNEKLEGKDIYLSDCGIYLPSQYDTTLHRLFPSFSIFYALSRQLYNSNIHCNTQNLERIFKALREQADSYIKCQNVIKLPGFLIVSFTYYERYYSAVQDMKPVKKGLFPSKELKARIELYNASNGIIQNGFVIIPKSIIKYDTRAFHEKVFNKKI